MIRNAKRRPGGHSEATQQDGFATTSSVQVAAFELARLGWPVLPLNGKVPLTRHGKDDATTDERRIHQWWKSWPAANVGIALPPKVIVLDVDPRHGGTDSLHRLTDQHGPIPATLVCVTGRRDGGCHFYLTHPGGRLSGRRLGEGIDLREGGRHYVVAPPSIHPETGRSYEWGNCLPVAECPDWIAELIKTPNIPAPAPPRPNTGRTGLVAFVAGLQPGNRNQGLFWAACEAARAGILDEIAADLIDAGVNIGLTAAEARRAVDNGRRQVTGEIVR